MAVCSMCGTHYGSTVRICIRDGTPLVAGRIDDPHLGQILDGKYRIDAFISAGGMGSVYRGVHVMLDKTVAVKVIRNELITSDEIVSRFQREARAASNLDHPNIVSVYDLGQAPDGTLYIAMEYIDGPSLKDLLRRDGPLSPADTVDILLQVASALSVAHRKQIVHRDLKSHNLMLATEHGRRVAKLVDFGIAKTFDESTQLTAAGFMLGTPHYMSPEQAAGRPVDHRADLYSLGVILYEMLTGDVPFGDAALTSVLVRLATEVPPPPSIRRPDLRVPPALDVVAMRCLDKDPDRRFQSADEFANALEHALDALAQPAIPRPAAPPAETLVRPALHRRGAAPQASAGVSEADQRGSRGGAVRTNWRVAAVAVVVVGATLAAAYGAGLFESTDDAQVLEATRQETPTPSSASTPSAVPSPQSLPPPAPSPAATVSAPATATATGLGTRSGQPRPLDQSPAPSPSSVASPALGPAVTPAPSPASSPAPTPAPTPESTHATPSASPAPTLTSAHPVTVASPPPQTRAPSSASLACQGVPDICSAVRTEVTRALQADGVAIVSPGVSAGASDITLTITVALVSEAHSTQFGTPVTTRTFSVELTGSSRGKALVMPEPRIFSFDPLFSGARLQENARAIGAGTADAVRVFVTGGKP